MSYIDVNLQETKTVGKDAGVCWIHSKSAVDGLIEFGKVLANIIIWLIIFIPLWAVIWAIVFFVRRCERRERARLPNRSQEFSEEADRVVSLFYIFCSISTMR